MSERRTLQYHRICDSSLEVTNATNISSESAALTKLHTFHHYHHIMLSGGIVLVHVSIDAF